LQPLHKTIFIRRRRENAHKKRSRPQRFTAGLGRAVILLISITLTLAVLAGSFVFTQVTRDLPSLDMLPVLFNEENGLFLEPTRIYDRSGEILLAELENPGVERRYLKLDPEAPNHFSAQLIRIMVASLQPDFWSSSVFSFAEWNNPQPVTIAERLADTLLLEKEPASLKRSIRMRLLAGQLVAKYGRVKVLEWYMNSAYAGRLAYSMDSAAQLYLGKSAQDLSLPEAVLLTSVHMAPGLNPLDTPAAAREYQQVLAENLALNGHISTSELTEILTTQVPFKTTNQAAEFTAFTRIVIDQAASIVGKQTLERGGLIILSTLDAGLQAETECILQLQLDRIRNNADVELDTSALNCRSASLLPGLPLSLLSQQVNAVGSAAVLETTTGEICALVGDIDWAGIESGLNSHQAGSLLTPVAAVAAFSRGFSPATLLWDLPPSTSGSGGVLDYSQYTGPMRLRTALVNDSTRPLVGLVERIGADTVWRSTEPLGLFTFNKSSHNAQVILEGQSLNILEAAHIYSVFATLGERNGYLNPKTGQVEPAAVRQVVTNSGLILYSPAAQTSQSVLSKPMAYLVHHMLADETARREAYGTPNLTEIGKPAGVKVGTTARGDEVWTAGYTRQYLAVSWVGLAGDASPKTTLDYRIAAGIWNALIQYASASEEPSDWEIPAGVSMMDVCDPSGDLATRFCPVVVNEAFLSGMEPASYDSMYREIDVNRETGKLATIFTPLELIERQTFFVLPDEARDWAAANGIPQPPADYDTIQIPPLDPDIQITSPEMFAIVHGEFKVVGTAAGEGFQSYSLQVGEGLNPASWQEIGSGTDPIRNSTLGTWATESDGLFALRLVVVHTDQQVSSSIIQVMVDNASPVVEILYPSSELLISAGDQAALYFQVDVTENVQVQTITWLVDGEQIAQSGGDVYSISWTPAAGSHTLQVEVTDTAGNTGSSVVKFSVTN